jgi:hypothetical protein
MVFVNSLHRCCSVYQPLVRYTKHVLCMCLVSVTVLRPQLYDCCMSRCLVASADAHWWLALPALLCLQDD